MIRVQSRREFKAGVRWLAWSGALAMVSIGGWLAYVSMWQRPAQPVPVRLLSVARGTIETTINESGTVELRGQQTLKSPSEGAVDQVLVQPGNRVRVGQSLLTLRYPERQTALANQQLQIQTQELTLARSREKITEAQEQLVVNEQELNTLAVLAQSGAISRQRLQETQDKVRNSRTTLRDAQLAARSAALELQRLQLERQRIQQQVQNTVVTAPLNGKVLDVKVRNGDGVELRTDLLTLGDPTQELVKLRLSTLNASRVQVNQRARVSVIGPNASVYPARVQSLYPQATLPEGQSDPNQVAVPATVRLEQPTQTLIPGSQVNVEIVLEQRQNVVALAVEAIQRSEQPPFVWVRDGQGRAQRREIQVGLEGLLQAEVRSGLRPGETVVVPPADLALEPGTPVQPQTGSAPADVSP